MGVRSHIESTKETSTGHLWRGGSVLEVQPEVLCSSWWDKGGLTTWLEPQMRNYLSCKARVRHKGEPPEIKLSLPLSPFCPPLFLMHLNQFQDDTLFVWLGVEANKKYLKNRTVAKGPKNSCTSPKGFINPHIQSWEHFYWQINEILS